MKIGKKPILSGNPVARPTVEIEAEKHKDHLQIMYLRRLHGLTEAQAQMMAVLIWGGLQ
jgi:hypothetical protein